jgi:FkbM family methyltransferase
MADMQNFINKVKEVIGQPKVILDVGSRDLGESINLSTHFPDARIIAFEPNPEQFQICYEKSKSYPNIEVYEIAASDIEGTVDFWIVGVNHGGSSLLEPIDVPYSDGTWKKVTVKTQRLDDILKELNVDKVDAVWIDVQGVEYRALKGMGKYFDDVKVMHTEASPIAYYKGQGLKNQLEEFLIAHKFNISFFPAMYHPYGEGDLLCVRK